MASKSSSWACRRSGFLLASFSVRRVESWVLDLRIAFCFSAFRAAWAGFMVLSLGIVGVGSDQERSWRGGLTLALVQRQRGLEEDD